MERLNRQHREWQYIYISLGPICEMEICSAEKGRVHMMECFMPIHFYNYLLSYWIGYSGNTYFHEYE